MSRRDSRPGEQRLYKMVVGGANLFLCAMLVYGIRKYFDLVASRFGHKFDFLPILMGGLAVWTAVRGFIILLRRSGEGS